MPQHGRILAALAVIAVAIVACNAEPNADATNPLSAECGACLAGGEESGLGCGAELDACTADAGCNDALVCELRNHCYERPSDGYCASVVGCRVASDAASSEQARAAFENCARTQCAMVCGFVAP